MGGTADVFFLCIEKLSLNPIQFHSGVGALVSVGIDIAEISDDKSPTKVLGANIEHNSAAFFRQLDLISQILQFSLSMVFRHWLSNRAWLDITLCTKP